MEIDRNTYTSHKMVFHPSVTSFTDSKQDLTPPALPPKTYKRCKSSGPHNRHSRARNVTSDARYSVEEPSDLELERQLAATLTRARTQHMRNVETCFTSGCDDETSSSHKEQLENRKTRHRQLDYNSAISYDLSDVTTGSDVTQELLR